jgi:hypothetical protein
MWSECRRAQDAKRHVQVARPDRIDYRGRPNAAYYPAQADIERCLSDFAATGLILLTKGRKEPAPGSGWRP